MCIRDRRYTIHPRHGQIRDNYCKRCFCLLDYSDGIEWVRYRLYIKAAEQHALEDRKNMRVVIDTEHARNVPNRVVIALSHHSAIAGHAVGLSQSRQGIHRIFGLFIWEDNRNDNRAAIGVSAPLRAFASCRVVSAAGGPRL